MEKLNIKSMIKYVRWMKAFNRNLHYAQMGKIATLIIQVAENAGTKVIQIQPHKYQQLLAVDVIIWTENQE